MVCKMETGDAKSLPLRDVREDGGPDHLRTVNMHVSMGPDEMHPEGCISQVPREMAEVGTFHDVHKVLVVR